jgi:hypothetical protein
VHELQRRQTARPREFRASIVTSGFPEGLCRHWCRGRTDALNSRDASARDQDDDAPQDHGRPGRRYLIRGGHVMSMDPAVGDFAVADVLVEGKHIAAVGPNLHARAPA